MSDEGNDQIDPNGPLPLMVSVTQAFSSRMPSQRVQDTITRTEGGSFGDIIQNQAFRVVAFRALMRDYPSRDITSLWMHAYDVEVAVVEPDPTNGSVPTPSLPSVGSGG
jgi:hypothetical protein